MAEPVKKIGKLSLAILENFVATALGEKFVDELRAPTDRVLALATAIENTEGRFIRDFTDKDLSKALFIDLKQKDRPVLKDAVGKFYDHPTDSSFPAILKKILLGDFKKLSQDRIDSAIKFYVDTLTEELALVDETFRENVRALADLRGEKSRNEMVEILRRVEVLLSQKESSKVENVAFRSLHQLPPPPADFTGRELLITQLLEDFNSHKGATISGLTGMGGIGKTVLGLAVAHQIAQDYPDAQIFLDLKGTTTPLSAVDIARHVILSFEPTADLRSLNNDNIQAAYQSVLHGKKVLLFFDNARSADQIAKLTPPADCAMLVTSRWTFSVAGLQTHKVGVMEEKEAIDFLLELCSRIGDKAAELATACGRLPLALRIAGSFLNVNTQWKVEKYPEELKSAKGRLGTLMSSRLSAELTAEPDVLATFELSYNGLQDDQKKNWRALGVFPASFASSAAAAIWELEIDETENLLGLLLRYSMVDFNENLSRYELHDLLVEFARSKMEDTEEQSAQIAYSVHYSNVLGDINQQFQKGGENLLAALRSYDIETIHIDTGQRISVVYLADSSTAAQACNWYAWQGDINNLRLLSRDQIKWIEDGLRASRVLDNKQAEGAHLGNLGNAYADLGDARKAIEYYEQCLTLHREIGDRRGEGATLGNLGNAYADLGDVNKAIEFCEQQLVIVREIGDRRGEGAALGNLGNAHADLGDAKKAIEFYEQNLVIAREIGDRRGEGATFGNLGIAYRNLGDAKKAIEFYEQRLIIAREIGDRRGEGAVLGNLGNAYADLGDVNKAIEFYEQHLSIAREIGDRRGEGNALFNTGLSLYQLEEKEKAIESVKQALKIYEAIESPSAENARNTLKEWGAAS